MGSRGPRGPPGGVDQAVGSDNGGLCQLRGGGRSARFPGGAAGPLRFGVVRRAEDDVGIAPAAGQGRGPVSRSARRAPAFERHLHRGDARLALRAVREAVLERNRRPAIGVRFTGGPRVPVAAADAKPGSGVVGRIERGVAADA